MENKILNRNFIYFLLAFFGFEAISFVSLQNQTMNNLITLCVAIIVFCLCINNLKIGFYFLLGELLIGSKGYLFFWQSENLKISIRMVLFAVLLLSWVILFWQKKCKWEAGQKITVIYSFLAISIILSAINGILNSELGDFFSDFNNWLYFLLLPVFYSAFKEIGFKRFFCMLFASSLYLSIKTFFLLIAFSIYGRGHLNALYDWIRNSGAGEITYITGNFYRIFMQSQVYVLISAIAIAVLLAYNLRKEEKKYLYCLLAFFSTAILASLSRSFWASAFIALIALLIYLLIQKYDWKKLLKSACLWILILTAEMFLLCAITRTYNPGLFISRLASAPMESAGSSRINQIKPIVSEIKNNWLFGYGFGKTATYISNDPRIRQNHLEGKYTTYAFELGWLDLWLKTGILGILAYLWLITHITITGLKNGPEGLILVLFCLCLASIHLFSPYLNHPLGIGLILAISGLLNNFKTAYNGSS